MFTKLLFNALFTLGVCGTVKLKHCVYSNVIVDAEMDSDPFSAFAMLNFDGDATQTSSVSRQLLAIDF